MDSDISIVPFKFKYLSNLHDLLNSNDFLNVPKVNMKTLPKIGYIAFLNKQPIAAGFLRRVEGGYAQMDTLTSNKHFGSKIRHLGITKVVDALISDAKDLKLHGILAFTQDHGTLMRAEAIGFRKVEQTLIALPLS